MHEAIRKDAQPAPGPKLILSWNARSRMDPFLAFPTGWGFQKLQNNTWANVGLAALSALPPIQWPQRLQAENSLQIPQSLGSLQPQPYKQSSWSFVSLPLTHFYGYDEMRQVQLEGVDGQVSGDDGLVVPG